MAFGYRRWRETRLETLRKGAEVVETACGPVEVARAGPAPYVLQLHGTPGGHDQGTILGTHFLEAGFGCLAVSRPGYLRTPLTTGESAEAQADAFAALLDALSISRVAVQGTSGGGPSAVHFAARHPDRTLVLYLTCAVSDRYPVDIPAWAKLLFSPTGSRLAEWFFERFPRAAIKQEIREESTYSAAESASEADKVMNNPELLTWMKALIGSNAPWEDRSDGFYNDLEKFKNLESRALPLESIRCPTLIVHGTADDDVPYHHAEQAYRRVPNATLHTLDNAHHLLWLSDQAATMMKAQTDFLKSHLP